MSENKNLLPCPFCGGKAEILEADFIPLPYMVSCMSEDCGANVGKFRKTKQEAIEVWNRRVCSCKE